MPMSISSAFPLTQRLFSSSVPEEARRIPLPRPVAFAEGSVRSCGGPGQSLASGHPRLSGERRTKLAERLSRKALQRMTQELLNERKEPQLPAYTPGRLDDFFLKQFREQLTKEAGWESQKPGYDGLVEVVKNLYRKSSKCETEKATIRVFTVLLPAWLVLSFRRVILPVASGKVAAVLMAFVTKATCQWLMGPCTVNEVTLADGSTLLSGVLVQRCKFLEETGCAGICTHACKMPTQAFIKDVMGTPLAMEPNFTDFSCQFKYGVEAIPRDEDPGLHTPCLSICPTAIARATLRKEVQTDQCPQV